jgi:diguanylate cyclase (GGDEF)-like protein
LEAKPAKAARPREEASRQSAGASEDRQAGGHDARFLQGEMWAAVLADMRAAAYLWNIATDDRAWSAGAEHVLGVNSLEPIATGHRYAQCVHPAGPSVRYGLVERSDASDPGAGVPFNTEYQFIAPCGSHALWVEDSGRWELDADGKPLRVRGVVRVVNERRAREERLLYRSDHDELTGALNRARLIEELAHAIDRAEQAQLSCALVSVAVDNLGTLNDTYGFDIGDQLVAGAAARLAKTVRRGDVLGRLGGNRIGVVVNGCGASALRTAVERLQRTVAEAPVTTDGGAIPITVSLGAVLLPRHGRTVGAALAAAQEALAEARRRGVSGAALFDPSPGREAERQGNIEMAGKVIAALNADRVALALQPIVAAGSGQPVFYEALCRLSARDGAMIAPSDFLHTAERLGIVRQIDHRALDLAMTALAEDPALQLSVNLAAPTALEGTWFARLASHLRSSRDLASRFLVEITETMAITDLPRTIDFVRSVKDLGCRVAIDDFGAGHTSFRNLRAMSTDLVKIDGSFIGDIATNVDDQLFVETLVRLAKHIGMETVAERVTSELDAAFLRSAGVDYLQGHLFGEPRIAKGDS